MSKTNDKVTTELTLVTPEIAEKLLLTNINNRNVSRRAVERLVYAMKAGQWKNNGETIKVSNINRLIDGQHRLTAVHQSGVACEMLIARGIHEDAVDTIDVGRKRTFGDWLSLQGEENTTALSAALYKLSLYKFYYTKNNYVKCRRGGLKYQTYSDLEKLLNDNSGIRHSTLATNRLEARRLFDRSVLASVHYLFSSADPEKADDFFRRLSTGANLRADHPILTLRNTAIRWKTDNYKPEIYEVMTFMIRVWNAFVENKKISHLRFNSEESFPHITGFEEKKSRKSA